MRLKDFFNFKDFVRVSLIGSALFFLMGSFYGVFLHSQFAGEITDLKTDLLLISSLTGNRSSIAYTQLNGTLARDLKDVSESARVLSRNLTAPPVSPTAYTYFNYWVASAAFTELTLSPDILGLPPGTVSVLKNLSSSPVLGENGWYNREEFYGFNPNTGKYEQFLVREPMLVTNFWTFYLFVFIISFLVIFFTVKESYEIPLIPEIIYGAFMPLLFFAVYALTSLLSLIGLVRFLDPSQVDLFVLLLSFVIMSVISSFGALFASVFKQKYKKR